MYSSDNRRQFPSDLGRLVPVYLRRVPCCAYGVDGLSGRQRAWLERTGGVNLGDYSYEVSSPRDAFTVSCCSANHARVGMFFVYSSREGLVESR